MKNKRGFTLIELLVSFALITIVSISLFRTVLAVQKKAIKDISYNQYIAFAATFNNAIELDFTNNTILSVAPCGQNCYDIIYSDSGTKRFSIDRNNNSVMYGTIKEKIPAYYEFGGDIKIELDTAYSAPSNAFNSVAKLIIPLKSSLLSFNQDLKYVYQYDNRVHDIAQTLYTTLTINPLGGKYDGSTENKVYNILPGQTINILDATNKSGYVFEKWNFSGIGSYSNGIFTAGIGDAVLTAGWLSYANMYTYSGTSSLIDDLNGNWRIKLYGPGTYTFRVKVPLAIDVFLVGGGGGGGSTSGRGGEGGGGGGRTYTQSLINLSANTDYTIVVGAGGSPQNSGLASTAFTYSANGGSGASTANGASGGSGGGGSSGYTEAYPYAGYGGSNGSNGGSGAGDSMAGSGGGGQGTTTGEFGNSSATLYGGGGSGGVHEYGAGSWVRPGGATGGGTGGPPNVAGGNGTANTGGGGGGGPGYVVSGGSGGCGIVIIRNHR